MPMENTHKFYKLIKQVQENKYPIRLPRCRWQDIEFVITPYVLEDGIFDNVHMCWRSALGSLLKKIIDKREYKTYTIKLTASEYYAIKEILDNTLIDPTSVLPGLLLFAEQIKKAQPL